MLNVFKRILRLITKTDNTTKLAYHALFIQLFMTALGIVQSVYKDIYKVVGMIPHGQVATYGQIARLIGKPGNARQVGMALANSGDVDLPWHRVVNAQGQISQRGFHEYEQFQRDLLLEEGVEFDLNLKIDLSRFQWRA